MIKTLAQNLIKNHQTNDPLKICEDLNIQVNKRNLGSINGYYRSIGPIKFIAINSNRSDAMQRYVCAHELGHALLHTDLNISFLQSNTFFNGEKTEAQANKFAIELLLPDDVIESYKDCDYTIQQIAKTENIPAELITYKYF